MEIDVHVASSCGRVALVEVKKTKEKTGVGKVRTFIEKLEAYKGAFPKKKALPAFFSVGGFTPKAKTLCEDAGIGIAERIEFLKE
ncbi:MAG: hypothetical protein GY859_24490, partial [Desulfobacterales bacterium]|nr:hypothetical protein [Desulfobacterales bacterium]